MLSQDGGDESWSPHFVDYLFLAFNTSTAFSPTDTAVLSRWAKLGILKNTCLLPLKQRRWEARIGGIGPFRKRRIDP